MARNPALWHDSAVVLERLADDLWTQTAPLRVVVVSVGARMMVARLSGGGLFVHSPVRLDDALKAELDALGPIEHIVAPNRYHHLFLERWVTAYPEAELWGAPGLEKKRKDLRFSRILGRDPAPWADELEPVEVEGVPILREFLFFHHATRSLFTADYLFNLPPAERLADRVFQRINGAHRGPCQARALRLAVRDRAAARRTRDRVLELPVERITIAHSTNIEHDAAAVLKDALAWL